MQEFGSLVLMLLYWFWSGWSWISFFSGAVAGIGGLWLLAKLVYG